MQDQDLTHLINGKAFELRRTIGPGHNAARYAHDLAQALRDDGLAVREGVAVWQKLGRRNKRVGTLDLVVEDRVGVTVIAQTRPPDQRKRLHLRHLLEAQGLPVGLLLNFAPHRVEVSRVEVRSAGADPR